MTPSRGTCTSISIAIVVLAVVGAAVVRSTISPGNSQAPVLPVSGTVSFSRLTDHHGAPFATDTLRGRVWIANFIFTSCPSQCVLMTDRLRGLQRDFTDVSELQFVSFTVDPAHDTPEVLAEYAARHGADSRWVLVTGARQALHRVCQEEFRLSVGDAADGQPITHSVKFILVDRAGQIRGYYDVTNVKELVRLRSETRILLAERG